MLAVILFQILFCCCFLTLQRLNPKLYLLVEFLAIPYMGKSAFCDEHGVKRKQVVSLRRAVGCDQTLRTGWLLEAAQERSVKCHNRRRSTYTLTPVLMTNHNLKP